MLIKTTVRACQTQLDLGICTCYTRFMCRNCYEVELPDPYVSWADQVKENKDTIKMVGKAVGIPTALFIAISAFNIYLDKKWGPL